MAKVTSKLQVTVPKALAAQYGIAPGDDIGWEAAGDAIRIVPARPRTLADRSTRLRLFDRATARIKSAPTRKRTSPRRDRGWTREDLYDRGRPC